MVLRGLQADFDCGSFGFQEAWLSEEVMGCGGMSDALLTGQLLPPGILSCHRLEVISLTVYTQLSCSLGCEPSGSRVLLQNRSCAHC